MNIIINIKYNLNILIINMVLFLHKSGYSFSKGHFTSYYEKYVNLYNLNETANYKKYCNDIFYS